MKKWTTLDQARTPDGKLLELVEHDGDYTIRLDGGILMTTRQHASEESLAEFACAHIKGKPRTQVLIGGLGCGFTLRAVLAAVGQNSVVTVAELMENVIAWNRNPDFPLGATALEDKRAVVVHRDVRDVIRESRGTFDAIVLDVDNGPAALCIDGNRRLYTAEGLKYAHAALRPGGCLALWAIASDDAFVRQLTVAGFRVEVKKVRARPRGGSRHTIFLAWTK